jgi:uncharacterized membrane protein YhaH (DUF805 family)
MHWGEYLFSFHGRVTRAKWWLFVLIFIVYNFAVTALCVLIFGFFGILWGLVLTMLLIWPSLAISEKRLHDRGKPGMWLLLFYLAPLALGTIKLWLYGDIGISAITHPTGLATVLSLGEFILIIWAIVELGILRGTVGDNEYGPDPLAHPPPKP